MGKSYNEKRKYEAKYGEYGGFKQPNPADLVKIKNNSIIDEYTELYIDKGYFSGKFGYYRIYTKEDGYYIPYIGATNDELDRLLDTVLGFSKILKVHGDYIK